jgi:hypothetical protein
MGYTGDCVIDTEYSPHDHHHPPVVDFCPPASKNLRDEFFLTGASGSPKEAQPRRWESGTERARPGTAAAKGSPVCRPAYETARVSSFDWVDPCPVWLRIPWRIFIFIFI